MKIKKIFIYIFLTLSIFLLVGCKNNNNVKNTDIIKNNDRNLNIEENKNNIKLNNDLKNSNNDKNSNSNKEKESEEVKPNNSLDSNGNIDNQNLGKESNHNNDEKQHNEDSNTPKLENNSDNNSLSNSSENNFNNSDDNNSTIIQDQNSNDNSLNDNKNVEKYDTFKDLEKNNNFTTYINNNKEIKILWVNGIIPPKMGENGDFEKRISFGYEEYFTEFIKNSSWFDQNKKDVNDDITLCFAAVASNMLYWWFVQNNNEINEYIKILDTNNKLKETEKGTLKDIRFLKEELGTQEKSRLFDLFRLQFRKYGGLQSDLVIDYFINGYEPKPSGGANEEGWDEVKPGVGYFYDIFKEKKVTNRLFSGNLKSFSNTIKYCLEKNNSIGIEHTIGNRSSNHIVTLWGAEFNEKGLVTAVYVTDSDDYSDKTSKNKLIAMKKYKVFEYNGRVKIGNKINSTDGAFLEYIHTLDLGKKYFYEFIKNNKK